MLFLQKSSLAAIAALFVSLRADCIHHTPRTTTQQTTGEIQ